MWEKIETAGAWALAIGPVLPLVGIAGIAEIVHRNATLPTAGIWTAAGCFALYVGLAGLWSWRELRKR